MSLLTKLARKTSPLLLGLPLLLAACDPEPVHYHDPSDGSFDMPAGGADFGMLSHYDHAFAEDSITFAADEDAFEFYLPEESLVVITATGVGGFDAYLDLFAGGFEFLYGDDDGGPGLDPVLVGTLQAGDYFVILGGAGTSVGDYAIDISVEPLGGADMGVLAPSDTAVDNGGSISDIFDVDSYVFTVNDNVVVDIFLTRTAGDYDGNLELVNEYGQSLSFEDPLGDADPAILGAVLTPGTYIIRVGANFGSGTTHVQVDVN